jgi:hypothetical protein
VDKGPYRRDKFSVTRSDGGHHLGVKHQDCRYFVIDLKHDEVAPHVLAFLAGAYIHTRPELAVSLAALRKELFG